MVGAWASYDLFWLGSLNARDEVVWTHAPTTTVLAQFVASYQTRAFRISPWHTARVQLLTRNSEWPSNGSSIKPQSRLHLNRILHLEIISRLILTSLELVPTCLAL